jgi:transcriptional regulator GlxA family with amidase domain
MASKLERIDDWIGLASQANFDIHELANHCHVSVRQMERFFKRSFQESPELWLKHLRLQSAQSLLSEGSSVKEVAYSLGFRQVSHFCREFKRFTGTTPSAFSSIRKRPNHRLKNVAVG